MTYIRTEYLTIMILDFKEEKAMNNELQKRIQQIISELKAKVQLNQEQRKEIIDKTENEIDSGKMKHLESRAYKFIIMAYKPYNTLSEFLEEAGVVYKVQTSGVYILGYGKRDFGKLVGYKYSKSTCRYCLYLL